MTRTDDIGEGELIAYVDHELDPARRVDVETYLAGQPQLAAQVMADLSVRNQLRLSMAGEMPHADHGVEAAAMRLQAGIDRPRWRHFLRPGVAAVALVLVGWLAHGTVLAPQVALAPAVPAYVDVAMRAYETSMLRASMYSQIETPEYDRAELLSATAITMPELPPDWQVTDVQVYPSQFGPSVEMAVVAPALGRLSIFAARPGQDVFLPPEAERIGGMTTAFWQSGEIAYALVGEAELAPVRDAATRLHRALP